MANIRRHVGPRTMPDGGQSIDRHGRTGETIVGQGVGMNHEAASRAIIYIASTAVAGVAPGTVLSTTPPLDIHNPVDSGVLVSILDIYVGYKSGTLGAGMLVHAKNTQATVPSTGVTLTPQNALLGDATVSAVTVGQGRTLSGVPAILRPSGIILGASLATTAALPVLMHEHIGGAIVIPEGQDWVLQGIAAAGSTPKLILSVVWQEIKQTHSDFL